MIIIYTIQLNSYCSLQITLETVHCWKPVCPLKNNDNKFINQSINACSYNTATRTTTLPPFICGPKQRSESFTSSTIGVTGLGLNKISTADPSVITRRVMTTPKLSLQPNASSDLNTLAGESNSTCNLGGGLCSVDE